MMSLSILIIYYLRICQRSLFGIIFGFYGCENIGLDIYGKLWGLWFYMLEKSYNYRV